MKTTLTSRRGARIVAASDGRETTLSIGVPRRGCGGVDPTSLQGAAWDTLVVTLREFEAGGVKTNLLTARNERRKSNSPDVLTVRAPLDARTLARNAAARFDGFGDDRVASLAMRPRNVTDVPLDEVVEEAQRQEQFQLPRRSGLYEGRVQSAEGARRMAVGTTRIIGREGRENGGYVFAEVPVAWIRTSPSHVDADRQARQGDIRGTSDPAFATSWARHDLADRGGVAGPALTLENGNNRVFFARQQGRSHYPVFVVRAVWEGLLRAIRDARRSGGEKACAAREAAPNGRTKNRSPRSSGMR